MAKYYSENDALEILDAEWKSTSVGILIFIFYTPNWQHDSCVQKVTEIKSTLLPRFFHFYKCTYHEIIRLVCTSKSCWIKYRKLSIVLLESQFYL